MTDALIEIEVEDETWRDAVADVESVVDRAARAALSAVSAEAPCDRELVILLADDEAVRDLNARFRDKDRPTNVLSFPAPDTPPGFPPGPLGDIVLASGVCGREAADQGKSVQNHLTHLVVHGVLHLLGRDHMVEAEAEAMEAEERAILAELGVSDPYEVIDDG
ncbi:rRNA maturation RNase YbeY [Brevundimonas sp. VNH65]|uniref:rRNA maturation RNase YbeY n=1 Tax=Brevundimonas sp. VNH65 TaxID=3400917 RepID=UPI003BFBE50E